MNFIGPSMSAGHSMLCPRNENAGAHQTRARAARPGKRAAEPSSSSMRRSWLYLAMRSVREAEPVLIWPAPMPTARSAMKASSVSPERCEMMEAYFALRAISTASIVSRDAADLIQLDQNRVGDSFGDAARENFRIGDENVVADELDFLSQFLGDELPAVPVVFGEAVFDGNDGILAHPIGPELDHLLGGARGLVGFLEDVFLAGAVVELARGGIERDGDLLAGFVSRGGDGFEDAFERLFVGFQVGREAAFVADGGRVAVFLEHSLQVVKNFDAPAQRLRENSARRRA